MAIQALESAITTEWNKLQSYSALQNVQLQPLSSEFNSLLKNIQAVFAPSGTEASQSQPLERLSDGQQSLFYFSLVGARFELEQQLATSAQPALFDLEAASMPNLRFSQLKNLKTTSPLSI